MPKAVTCPKTTISTKPKNIQHALAPETRISAKTLTLTDYTRKKSEFKNLIFRYLNIPEQRHSFHCYNKWQFCISYGRWKRNYYKNDTLSFQRQIRITNQPTLVMTKVVHGPQSKIIAGFEESANTSGYMTHLYEIYDKCQVSYIIVENRSFCDMADDENHVYGLHKMEVFRLPIFRIKLELQS